MSGDITDYDYTDTIEREVAAAIASDPSVEWLPPCHFLDQDEIWTDKEGNQHRIDEMSVRYKANVVAFLERRAVSMEFNYSLGEARFIGGMAMHAQELAEDACGDEWERRMDDPVAWLRSTRLMKRLIDDVANGRGGEDD